MLAFQTTAMASTSAPAEDESRLRENIQAMLHDHSESEGDEEEADGAGDGRRRGGGGDRGAAPLSKRGGLAPRPSVVPRMSIGGSHHRRRSSIFLRRTSLGGSSVASVATLGTLGGPAAGGAPSQENLMALYKKTLRMNAENRINTANSWNLNLIDHIDKFVHEDDADGGGDGHHRGSSSRRHSTMAEEAGNSKENGRRVNFTKASCTLDASIKIYGYRVDDVYLTSHKVLANLNRNDGGQAGRNGGGDLDARDGAEFGEDADLLAEDHTEDGLGRNRRKMASKAAGPTLETNLANINMNKLDSAFDIDPLFHKMSKTFDEGGAKGLLLVNLGLGPQCNIVFDSSSEDAVADIASNSTGDDADREAIDMVQLASKFLAPEDDLFGMPLVPQLENLRAQLEGLVQEGFTDDGGAMDAPMTARKSRNSTSSALGRYAANDSDEQQADVSIHQEAVSRSLRLSSERELSVMMDEDETSSVSNSRNLSPSQPEPLSFSPMQEYAPDDFGGGNDDYDDYDGGGMPFDDSPVTMGARFSMLSQNGQRDASAFVPPSSTQATSELLDRIASSSHVLANSDYEFINSQMMIDNAWAGAAFWKRKAQRNQRPKKPAENDKSQKTPAKKKATKKKKKKVTSGLVFDEPPDLADILVKPKRQLLQWSRAVINKHSKEENLLPLDTGMGVEQLTQLFLRPDMAMYGAARPGPSQNVGFHPSTDSWYENDGGSFGGGDENDGPGFDFGGDDDNENHVTFAEDDAGTCLPELKGVRKVEKVSVGYATVAKKVDVKRLKKELWLELESHFGRDEDSSAEDDDEDRLMDSSQRTSFQAVVRNMESCKSQADVSLPFYFICILHLANEKGLRFESTGLGDFEIYPDVEVTGPSF